MTATIRGSAPKGPLMASIPEAAPGSVPKAAVLPSRWATRVSRNPIARLKSRVPPTMRITGSKLEASRGRTEGVKVAARTPPTTASEAVRAQRGTLGCSGHASAHATATTIGPTSHAAGMPTTCANSPASTRSEEHTSELQSRQYLVCRLLLEKKKNIKLYYNISKMYFV